MSDHVVFVHGIWMPRAVMAYLKQHLQREHGFHGHLFSYASVRATLDENADHLSEFIASLGLDKVHLVGHSLGGVVSLRMLAQHADAPAGRIVCLGSPLCGCVAAARLRERGWGGRMLGKAIVSGVLQEPARQWAGDVVAQREIGVIAGTRALGLGRLLAKFDEGSDGTVGLSETRLPGVRDHLTMPVSHFQMVMSRSVADQTAAFLRRGEFLRDESSWRP